MATTESWPPRSPHHALLSSPSGRKRFQEYRAAKTESSPAKTALGTPSLLDRLRAARVDRDQIMTVGEEEEEDEETLQLKLAAIEARLKLKKLQQNKARQEDNARPQSSSSSVLAPSSGVSRLEVPLSPTRRPQPTIEQRSPGRVLLGIDKGISAADVSLKRARTIGSSPTKDRRRFDRDQRRPTSRISAQQPNSRSQAERALPHVKSFSERMADVRNHEQEKERKAESIRNARSHGFNLNHTEVDRFKAAATEATYHLRPHSPIKQDLANTQAKRDDVDLPLSTNRTLKESRTLSNLRESPTRLIPTEARPSSSQDDLNKGDASLFEGFSGVHLSSRVLPHAFLKRTLPSDQYTVYRLPDLLKVVKSPAFEIPDNVTDYVIFGIIASKSSPLDQKVKSEQNSKASNEWEKKWDDGSNNRKKFMVFTLTDLKWSIDMYLFDSAVPRYHRLTPGTVIAVLNPSIMPPKKGREATGAFSLALHAGEEQILEIGTSKHLSFCKSITKAGKQCGSWVDGSKTEICEWHLDAQVAKTQARRMGVNTGTNGFGGARTKNQSTGVTSNRFDSTAAPRSSAPIFNPDRCTARLLDMDDTDDPFIAEGQLSRDREARMQKRLASQEKERQIARSLASMGSGGAGGDYMRHRTGIRAADINNGDNSQRPTTVPAVSKMSTVMNDPSQTPSATADGLTRKRAAGSVRLSPVKKTRFLTDRGIKEAGRESSGPLQWRTRTEPATGGNENAAAPHYNNDDDDDDDDDDLDII